MEKKIKVIGAVDAINENIPVLDERLNDYIFQLEFTSKKGLYWDLCQLRGDLSDLGLKKEEFALFYNIQENKAALRIGPVKEDSYGPLTNFYLDIIEQGLVEPPANKGDPNYIQKINEFCYCSKDKMLSRLKNIGITEIITGDYSISFDKNRKKSVHCFSSNSDMGLLKQTLDEHLDNAILYRLESK